MSDHFHLFVYGTLRSGHANAARLDGCELIGNGTVGGILYDIDGAYPALVLYGNAPVQGEVWRVPSEQLLPLDDFEGVAESLFRRVGVDVTMADGSVIGCWTYTAGPKLSRKLVPAKRIEAWA